MSWWQWLIVIWLGWGIVYAVLERRADTHRWHWRDGCAKPFFGSAFRSDGSPKPILPRRGDGEVEELEHMWDHERSRDD